MTVDISVVIPVFNESENIDALSLELKETLNTLPKKWEVLFIDDGSTDDTSAKLQIIAERFKGFGFLRLARRSGQSAALALGFARARGEIVVSLDGDGQNDPKDIPLLLNQLDHRHDVVCGWRKHRADNAARKLASRWANTLVSLITGVPLHDHGCSLRAYRQSVLKNIQILGDMHRLLPAYLALMGVKIKEVETNHRPRQKGKSKYGLASRTIKVLLDSFLLKFYFSYLTRPMHFFGYASFGFLSLGGAIESFVIIRRFVFQGVWISPLFFLGLFFMASSILFLFLGAMADVIVRHYLHASNTPLVLIEKEHPPHVE